MATKIKRHLWECPQCGTQYKIPCPQCSTDIVSQPESISQALKKRRSAGRWKWLAGIAVLGGVAVLIIVCAFLSGTFKVPESIAKRIAVIDNDPDRNAVRKWLSENLDSPRYEEVKWWPVIVKDGPHDIAKFKRRLKEYADKKQIFLKRMSEQSLKENVDFDSGLLDHALKTGPKRLIRVKFRSKTPFGGMKIQDKVFLLKNDTAVLAAEHYQYQKNYLFEEIPSVENQGMSLTDILDAMKHPNKK